MREVKRESLIPRRRGASVAAHLCACRFIADAYDRVRVLFAVALRLDEPDGVEDVDVERTSAWDAANVAMGVRRARASVWRRRGGDDRWIVDWFKLPRGVLDRVVAYERWYNVQASMVDGGWMSQMWLTRTEVGEDFEKVFSGDERGGAVDDGSNVRAFSSGEFE